MPETTSPHQLTFDPDLIRRYDKSGPRYTSYPTADRFVEAYGEDAYRTWAARRNIGGIQRPLSSCSHAVATMPTCSSGSNIASRYRVCISSSRRPSDQ